MQPLLLLLLLALSPVSSFPGSCIKRSSIRKDVPNSFNILKSEGRLRAANGEGDAVSKEWDEYFRTSASKERYQIVAAPEMESLAQQIVEAYPSRFRLWPTQWKKFPDGTDNIEIGGFSPTNHISGENVLMLASFHNNDVTLSQFSVMITLLQSFIKTFTVVLPFSPVGTMERVTTEGQVATANTYAQMFSNLPSCGKPTRLITYDLHTLQNRFYLHGNAIASLQTSIPLLIKLSLIHISEPTRPY